MEKGEPMRRRARVLGAAYLLVCATAAHAEIPGEISANVTLTTDYVFRGVTQTDGDPAVQGGFDYAHPTGFYAGIWGSNVKFPGDPDFHLEVDVWAGFAGQFGELGWDLGILRYMYPGTGREIDFNEFYVGTRLGMLTAYVHHSNDYANTGGRSTHYRFGAEFELPQDFELGVRVGFTDFSRAAVGPDTSTTYFDWHIGVSTQLAGVDFELAYADTDSDGRDIFGRDATGGRVLFSVSRAF
jgi:uncharacterized protein (TIGR02001 family)